MPQAGGGRVPVALLGASLKTLDLPAGRPIRRSQEDAPLPTTSPTALPRPPARRADCIDGPRPCPWIGCRYHLQVERRARQAPTERAGQESCSLDLADRGRMRLQEIADVLGVTRERVRQIELKAMAKLAADAPHLAEHLPSAR